MQKLIAALVGYLAPLLEAKKTGQITFTVDLNKGRVMKMQATLRENIALSVE